MISILAGNPKVERIPEGVIKVEPQIIAFEKGLKLAREMRGKIGKVAVVVDHLGIFANQFLAPGLKVPHKDLPNLTMSQVHPDIASHFAGVADDHDIPLSEIGVLTEDFARLRILRRMKQARLSNNDDSSEMPVEFRRLFAQTGSNCQQSDSCTLDEAAQSKPRVNCRGITAADIEKLSRDVDEVHTFWEFDSKRVQPAVITQGTQLAMEVLEVRTKIIQSLIFQNGHGQAKVQKTTFEWHETTSTVNVSVSPYREMK